MVVVDVVVVEVVLLVVVPHCRVQIVNDFELNLIIKLDTQNVSYC